MSFVTVNGEVVRWAVEESGLLLEVNRTGFAGECFT